MIKLTKTKLNEILYYIQGDNFKNYLVLKLIYIYGRNARDVFSLKPEDINLIDNTVSFSKDIKFPLIDIVNEELMGYVYDNNVKTDEYIFREMDEIIEVSIKKLNYYLDHTIDSINNTLELNSPKLTTKDFKILRGQHLFLEGTELSTIHKFYHNSNIMSTKDNINYNELYNLIFPCRTVEQIFTDNTDLNVFSDEKFGEIDLCTVSDDIDSLIIELDYNNNSINLITDEDMNIAKKVQKINPDKLSKELNKLSPGNYKYLDGLKFFKN